MIAWVLTRTYAHSSDFYSGLPRLFIYIAGLFPLPGHSTQDFEPNSTVKRKSQTRQRKSTGFYPGKLWDSVPTDPQGYGLGLP